MFLIQECTSIFAFGELRRDSAYKIYFPALACFFVLLFAILFVPLTTLGVNMDTPLRVRPNET